MVNTNSSTMNMEAQNSCEILACTYLPTQNHIPDDHNLKTGRISLQNGIRKFLIIMIPVPRYVNVEFISATGTLTLLRCLEF
jgi:hypothetical protein